MPIPVYHFNLRGNNLGGNFRCASKEAAQTVYDTISKGLSEEKEFIEIGQGDDVATVRAKDIAAFGINVTMEETQEEKIARARRQLEAQIGNSDCYNESTGAIGQYAAKLAYSSGGII